MRRLTAGLVAVLRSRAVGWTERTFARLGRYHRLSKDYEYLRVCSQNALDGRTVDLAALADGAGLDVASVAGLVQELVGGQAAAGESAGSGGDR